MVFFFKLIHLIANDWSINQPMESVEEKATKKMKLEIQEINVSDVAFYIIKLCKKFGFQIDILKIQKLVYIAQGFYLSKHKKPLFNEDFLAFPYGPCIDVLMDEMNQIRPDNYLYLKRHGQKEASSQIVESKIPLKYENIEEKFNSKDLQESIHLALITFGDKDTFNIVDFTHDEILPMMIDGKEKISTPWRETREENIIKKEWIQEYFSKYNSLTMKVLELLFNFPESYREWIKLKYEIFKTKISELKQVQKQLENYFKNIEKMKIKIFIPPWIDTWNHQSIMESFLAYLFYPIQFEIPNELPIFLYSQFQIISLLYLSENYENPLAKYHLREIYSQMNNDHFKDFEIKLNEEIEKSYDTEKKAFDNGKTIPYYSMGKLSEYLLKEEYQQYFEKGKEFCKKCKIYLTNDKTLLKEIGTPEAYFKLAEIETDNDIKMEYLMKIKDEIPYSNYLIALLFIDKRDENNAEKFLKISCNSNIAVAYYSLSDLYFSQNKEEDGKNILLLAGNNKIYSAFSRLAERVEKNESIENAIELYQKDVLGGFYFISQIKENEEIIKKGENHVKNLFQHLFE